MYALSWFHFPAGYSLTGKLWNHPFRAIFGNTMVAEKSRKLDDFAH
jgi:hypothetical protein